MFHSTRSFVLRKAWLAAVPALMLATACGDDPVTPPPVKNPAKILSFTSDRATVQSGERVTLSWSVQDATSVTIRANNAVLVDASDKATGTVMSGELTAQTVFTIVAVGAGGNAMSSVTVDIAAPNAVQITSFRASANTVVPNAAVTLTWETANATSVTLTRMGAPAPIVDASTTRLNSSETVMPSVTGTYILTAQGAAGTMDSAEVTITVEGTPVIMSFTSDVQAIELGASATLSWQVTGAMTITIMDSAGTPVPTGNMANGNATVSPTMSTAYTLTAASPLGQMVTSMPVMVTVNRAAIVNSFTANPTTIDYGDTAQLSWSVARAPGGVVITARGVTVRTSSLAMSTITVTPTVSTAYTLTARNTDGDTMAMASVTVNPIAPRIRRFDAAPNPAHIGDQSVLSWSTIGALNVRVTDPAGTSIYSGTDADGTVTVTVTGTIARYTLEAINPNGITRSTLDLAGERDPVIDTLTVTPQIFITPTVTATLTWTTHDALTTSLTINGQPIAGFTGTATGSFTFTATTTSHLVLTAANNVAQSTREVIMMRLADGTVDLGNTAATATPLGNYNGAIGEIGPTGGTGGDLDFYSFTVAEGGSVYIETSDGRGGCPFDSLVTLIAPDGTTVVGSDDDDGVGTCSLINPATDAFARNLPAGTYYVQVRGFGTTSIGVYVLSVLSNPARCGNSLLETRAAERCDDGNTTSGDGCSATCTAEPLVTMMGPGTNQNIGGGIITVGRTEFVRIDMLAPGYIAAEVFIPSVGRCDAASTSADPILTLLDGNFTVLGSDDNDGVASCAKIDPTFDTFASVPAGTYWLRINENGDNATIPSYVLQVRTLGQGCGNTLLEGTEECDDGNAQDGDGCSSVCVFEGLREVEPNNTFATGTVIVPPANSFIVRGSITPVADEDYYLFDVPAGYHIDAYITVNSLDQCPDDPEGQVGLYNPAGTLQGSTNFNGGPQGNCGRVWPYTLTQARAVTAGRWGIRVFETGNNAAIGVYFLHVNLIPPGCGNTIREGTELCDDGNTAAGDGCSATCTFEPVATVNLSALGTSTVTGAISPEYNRDAIRLQVTGPSVLLRAETFVSATGASCPVGTTTRLRLFDNAGVELGTDATDGVNSCSLITPQTDTFARLTTGDYWLVIEEDGNNALIPNYDVVVRGLAADVCGNGVTEYAVGEQCDGQAYCTAACQINPVAVMTGPTSDNTNTNALAVGEVDFYRLDVTAEAYILAETGVPTIGTCGSGGDTVIRIFSAANGQQLYTDDDGGLSPCSRLPNASSTPRVMPGTYFITVEEFGLNGAIPAYQLRVRMTAPNACGNGVREGTEQCDDGGTAAGDGCSAICELEPQGFFTGPGTPAATFNEAISVVGEIDRFQITVTAEAYLRAETFAPTAGLCNGGVDTVIRLRNAAGTELGSDDEDGINSCSLITPSDAFARLQPGTYFLSVEDYLNNGTVAAYAVTVNLVPVNACGNGVREGAETCDDGNTAAGDGCSATCVLEPDGTVNGPTGGYTNFAGAIEALADNDVYAIILSQPSLVRIDVSDPSSATCANTTFTPFLALLSANGSTIETDSVDGPGNCSLIGRRVLPAGSYTVRVEENGNNALLAAYSINIETIALSAINGTYAGPGGAAQVFPGVLDTLGDVDVYGLTLNARGRLVAETGAPMGACPTITTVLRVFDTNGYEMTFDSTDGISSCSLIAATDRFDLPAGSYFVVVEESGRNSLIASYEVSLNLTTPPAAVCGDGFREFGEQCDDGNGTASDGCTACVLDNATIVQDNNASYDFAVAQDLGTIAPNSTVNVSANLLAGTSDWFRFTLAGPANVRVSTYGTAGAILTSCTGDTVMSLYSGRPGDPFGTTVGAAQPTLIEYDDEDGPAPGNCSMITGTAASPGRRALVAGTYWVQVRYFLNNTALGQYYLNVDVAP